MKATFRTERELAEFTVNQLISLGFQTIKEVPNLGQSVDIVARKGNKLILIETKLHNWRKALNQASSHLFVADYVYIVLPKKLFSSELYETAVQLGIGVIEVDANNLLWCTAVKAARNKKIWLPQREQFLRHMEKIENAH